MPVVISSLLKNGLTWLSEDGAHGLNTQEHSRKIRILENFGLFFTSSFGQAASPFEFLLCRASAEYHFV
jgi:hypothetical protein